MGGCVASKHLVVVEPGSAGKDSNTLPPVKALSTTPTKGDCLQILRSHYQQDSLPSSPPTSPSPSRYEPAQRPVNETDRLNALYATGILDTPSDSRFDDITKLLCNILKAPMAIVSLVDQYRCWMKSSVGMPVNEAPREVSICAWTLLPAHPEMLVVPDTLEDGRFQNCPLVTGPPHIRFYAGAPLVTSQGFRLGNLVVMDTKARQFDAEACNLLANFAEIVVRQIEKTTIGWSRSYVVNQHAQGMLRALDWFSEGLMLCHVEHSTWKVLYVNDAWTKLTGVSAQAAAGADFLELAELVDAKAVMLQVAASLANHGNFQGQFVLRSGLKRRLSGSFRPAQLGPLHNNMPLVGIPSTVPWHMLSANSGQSYYFGTLRPDDSDANARLVRRQTSGLSSRWEWEGDEPFSDVILGPVLGQGSFGKVFRGVWQGTPVAIKVLQFQQSRTDESKARARVEAALNLKVSHPQIVPTYKTACRVCKAQGEDCMPSPSTWQAQPNLPGGSQGPAGSLTGGMRQPSGPASLRTGSLDSDEPSLQLSTSDSECCSSRADGASCSTSGCGGPRHGLPASDKVTYEIWLAMQLCDMGTLVEACEKGWLRTPRNAVLDVGKPDMLVICETAREIASALTYLHGRNIIHGDLTGSNVLLMSTHKDARQFTAKVSDFGLSRVVSSGFVVTDTVGTMSHMPPEMLSDGELSTATDVYAFGVLLWELYNGKRAWAGMHPMQIMFNVAVKKRILDFPDDTPASYVALAHSCLCSQRADRPSFDTILARLDDILHGELGKRVTL